MSEDRLDRIERGLESIVEQQAQLTLRQIEISERHDLEMGDVRQAMAEVRKELGRGVRLSVEEARRERVKRRELDERMTRQSSEFDDRITKIAELLKAFLQRGGNGKA